MTLLLRRPILVGGLSLTAAAWLLNSLHSTATDLGGTVVWAAIALGSGIWWLKQQSKATIQVGLPTPVTDRSTVEKALSLVESRINQLAAEINPTQPTAIAEPVLRLRQQLAQLTAELERQKVRMAVMGGKAVGKTTLSQLLKSNGVVLDPAPLASSTESSAAESAESEQRSASVLSTTEVEAVDLILFITTGDLTDSEFQTLRQLRQQNHRLLLLFNKQDQYLPDDRPVILNQLQQRVQEFLPSEDVLAVSTQPAPVKVRQHQADGSIQERTEQPDPDIAALQSRLAEVLAHQSQPLILATVQRQAQALNRSVQAELNQLRRKRALPIIEQYQWIAAAATFANPVPSLDLLATATITAQLVVDLGAIYQQNFSLEQAKTVMGNLASQMVKLGLVEMASQAIAPILKSHALTYVAGGTIQGLSAAYLTRVVGLSLVEYFEEQSQILNTSANASFQIDRLVQKLKQVFQENQRSAFLQNLVKQGISRLLPEAPALSSPAEP